MNRDSRPCPFCGSTPTFSGAPEPRDSNRYFVYPIPCGCHGIEVHAGSWGYYREGAPIDWPERASKRAGEVWNLSFQEHGRKES